MNGNRADGDHLSDADGDASRGYSGAAEAGVDGDVSERGDGPGLVGRTARGEMDKLVDDTLHG